MASSAYPDSSFDFNDPYDPQDLTNGSLDPQSETTTKLKRTACMLCRKRKLRCDTARPKCGTCARLGHDCEYNEVRKKSGPKRGYVKALEARLCTMPRSSEGSVELTLYSASRDTAQVRPRRREQLRRSRPDSAYRLPGKPSWQTCL